MATHIEGEAMQVNDGRDNRQAQAKTTLFIVAAIKALKHQFALSQRDTWPSIEHFNARAVCVIECAQGHPTFGRCGFDRITQ